MSPRRILIIGAGASGLVTLRNLLEVGEFETVHLVERRDDVGGVWYLDNKDKPRWQSPAYPNLVGNVLPEYLSFSRAPFPLPPSHPDQPYPTLLETHDYLRDFAAPLKKHISLNVEVLEVLEVKDGWNVTTKDWDTSSVKEELWDAVVVCVQWYDNAVWPAVEGLDVLRKRGLAIHAQTYKGPQGSEGKRVLIIGNGNSGNDIAAHTAPIASAVYRSILQEARPFFVSLPDVRIEDVPVVQKYSLNTDTNKISAELSDGRILHDIDIVYVASGYRPFPSFIRIQDGKKLMHEEIKPHRIPSLYRMILYAPNPTLAFIGTSFASFTPFPIADLTSIWLALAWRGEVGYPATSEERLASENERFSAIQRFGESPEAKTDPWAVYTYNVLGSTEEAYAAGIRADIVEVRPDLDAVLMVWNPAESIRRKAMYSVKRETLQRLRDRAK